MEDIKTVGIGNLKEKPIPGMDKGLDALKETGNSEWTEAFKNRDYKNLAPAYVYRGNFELSQNFSGSEITFFYKSIGREQSIYINGKEIGINLKENAEGNTFKLDHSILKPGQNQVDIIATPIPKKYDWDNVNTNPGLIQIFTPRQPGKENYLTV